MSNLDHYSKLLSTELRPPAQFCHAVLEILIFRPVKLVYKTGDCTKLLLLKIHPVEVHTSCPYNSSVFPLFT